MKNLLLSLALVVSGGAWADCSNTKTSLESQQCLNNEVKLLKSKLDMVFQNAHKQTQAKKELQDAQNAWLKYNEAQCGAFIFADTQGSPATVEYDLSCQAALYNQRIELLESLF